MLDKPFQIVHLTGDMVKDILGNPTRPHRHDYEELIVVTQGSPCHYIDFKKEQLTAPVAVYVAMGKVHEFIPDEHTRGWALRYNNEFIPQSAFHFYSNFLDNINYPVNDKKCLEVVIFLCEMIQHEYTAGRPNNNMIRHLVGALFAKLEATEGRNFEEEPGKHDYDMVTFNNFLKILEENFRRPEGVDFYAGKLNMTSRNLNSISKKIFNKSVSEIIESRKLTEARQLLLHSNKSVSEIGFEIGYNEKSYFSRVFHKKTGLTPTEYKSRMQALLA